MTRRRISRIAATILGATALVMTAGVQPVEAAVAKERTPSFKQFERATLHDADGQYVVNGDEPISSMHSLRTYYRQVFKKKVKANRHKARGLIVNTVWGADDRWNASQARNLSYCVSTGFGTSHDAIVAAMAQGAGLWESASSGVDFTYVPSADSNCVTSNNSVLFSVEPVETPDYIARAFFPSSPDSARNVLIDNSIFTSGSWTPGNILGHELGHTLGFRHEHTRPEAGTCFEDNNWRALTPYDSASIMHYPQCNGSSADLRFSATDGTGIRALYGS